MSPAASSALTLAAGTTLVCALGVLWLSSPRGVIRVVAAQGASLGIVAGILGVSERDAALTATAAVVLALKAVVVPTLLARSGGAGPGARESRPLVNVPASLVAAAGLLVLAFGASRGVVRLAGSTTGRLVPLGIATMLIGLFVMVSRRRPLSQMAGLLVLDNGIALTAFLCTAGVPFLVELGVSLDLLLGVVVLLAVARHLDGGLGELHLDELRELRD